MGWGTCLRRWQAYMVAAGLPTSTVGLRLHHMSRVSAGLPGTEPATVSLEALEEWLARQVFKPNTRRSYRSTLRAFYAWAMAAGVCTASPAHQLPTVKVPRAVPRPTPEALFRAALRGADDRERLGLMLAGFCGLRVGEVARTRREDLEEDLVGWSLRVVGKGRHVRLVPVPEVLAAMIATRPPGWLFPSAHGGHLTPAHLGKVISATLPEGWTTHTLRHRCGTKAYAATKDLLEVQTLLGHAKPETTAIYVQVPMTAVRSWMAEDVA